MTMASAVTHSKVHVARFDNRDVEQVSYTMAATGVTGSSNSTALDLGVPSSAIFKVVIGGSASDTYSLTVIVQSSIDNTNWFTSQTLVTAAAADGTTYSAPCTVGRYVRVLWTKNSGTMLAETITVTGIIKSD